MAVRYVGGEPTRITCDTWRKNTTRFMEIPKNKHINFDPELIFCAIVDIISVVAIIVFIIVCFR